MRKNVKDSFLLFVLNICLLLLAQDGRTQSTIKGRVLSFSDELLNSTTVTNKNSTQTIVTNATGEFSSD